MNREVIICAVGFAVFALLDLALSSLVAVIWRTRAVAPANLPPAVRARRLLYLRFFPATTAGLITVAIVTPAFAMYEPARQGETVGPAIQLLAIAAMLQLAGSIVIALRSAWLTARIEKQWMRSATAFDAGDLPAFMIDAPSPILALVGVFSPKLMAARSIVEACSAAEVAAIAGHERGHLHAGDNFKRWVMAFLPDVLRWTPVHDEIVEAWHFAAEDAADDAATGGDAQARAELAALLLKVVRLAPRPLWNAAIVSPFVERDGLERRVRRLLLPELEPPAPLAIVPMLVLVAMMLAGVAAMLSPDARQTIFRAMERLVELGR